MTANQVLAIISTGAVWYCCGFWTTLRLVVAMLLLAVIFAIAIDRWVPCGGWGEGFRMFYNVTCN